MFVFYSVSIVLLVVLLTIKFTSVYHQRRREHAEEIARLDQIISDMIQQHNTEHQDIHRRIDGEVTDVHRRIDSVQEELIKENASILKSVKSR